MSEIPLYSIPDERIKLKGFKLYSIKSGKSVSESYPGFPDETHIPHRHDFFEIFVFFKGAGTHEIDFNEYPIHDNSIHFVTPGQVHVLTNSGNSEGYILAFSEEFIQLNNRLSIIKINEFPEPYLSLSEKTFAFANAVLNEIKYEYSSPRPQSEEIIKSYLHIFLLKSLSHYESVPVSVPQLSKSKETLYKSFLNTVEEDYKSHQQVSYYADKLNISPSHLNKISKSICGKTASDLIHHRVMLEAKRLLVFSDLSGKEIAYHLKYEDPSYFSRIFKKKTGYSPTNFRELNLSVK